MTAGRYCFKRLAAENGFTAQDVGQLILTQVRKTFDPVVAERCGVPVEKCHTIMERYGYTGSACIPMCWTTPSNWARSGAATLS